jgi:excisionase family DNA binding protein
LSDGPLTFTLSPELVERVAQRASELLAERVQQPDGFLNVRGAAAVLACPTSRIYSLVSAGRIPHHKHGSRTLFDRAELREYVRNGGARRP